MMGPRFLRDTAARFLASRAAASQGLRATSYDDWHPDLDEALRTLPQVDICPHELFRSLMKNPSPVPKRTILVREGTEPVALAGLRRRGNHWEPVTQWIVPGMLFPVKDGYIGRTLSALGLDVHVGWWRWDTPPPSLRWIRNLRSAPTFGMRCTDDFEKFWRSTGHFKRISNTRNKCRDFEFLVDSPGVAEWTIRHWEARWRPLGAMEMPDLADRLLVAKYFQGLGLYHSLSLHQNGEIVAAATLLDHHSTAVAQVNYRHPDFDRYAVMTRLIDLSFTWARDSGFKMIDIGGSQDYKHHWAPPQDEKWEFRVCPDYLVLAQRCTQLLQSASDKLTRLLR